MKMETLLSIDALIALLTLTAMETVLGIDNIIFIAILVAKVIPEQREKVRSIGIILALVIRVGLLFSLSWIMSLKDPLFSILMHSFSGRDLILIFGGLFLIGKSTYEIHHKMESGPSSQSVATPQNNKYVSTVSTLVQILILDIVFSLDSVITAVGMADQVIVMVVAMILSMIIMLMSAKAISRFVDDHPTIKILALSFLLLIGVMLTVEGMGGHVSKGYIYFAMSFSLIVELLNIRFRKKQLK